MQKVGTKEFETQALKLVQENDLPVTADYVARQLSVAWDTARALLLGLACQGKIEAIKTMKSWVFKPSDPRRL